MPIKIIHIQELNLVEAIFTGLVTFNEIKSAVIEAVDCANTHHTKLYLCDCTNLKKGSSIVELYGISDFFVSQQIDHSMKQAVIMSAQNDVQDELRFYETTTRNRGYNVQLFQERLKAIQWLLDQ